MTADRSPRSEVGILQDARDVCGPGASSGSGLAPVYAFAVSLVVAPHVPYGVAAWAAVWSVVVFRAGSSFARRPVSDRSPAGLPARNTASANPANARSDGAA